ncbi:hypothetical protein Nepgr_003585 [Nepenthes gracilis]|uniref:Uncharacterized protein n=1 Tax=Nepenthes gracilis TaxID=150966 RepID=A0AAD3RZT6_NEPGR|nr:hypothetical protein Nepgr_003585 [Nepenthes gracilis]
MTTQAMRRPSPYLMSATVSWACTIQRLSYNSYYEHLRYAVAGDGSYLSPSSKAIVGSLSGVIAQILCHGMPVVILVKVAEIRG